MKNKIACLFVVLMVPWLLLSCGDEDSSKGTLSMNITDARPLLPADTQNVYITFDEVLVHRSGGSWSSAPMAETPYTIDLLQFSDGASTSLVPPVQLETGKYTQIRLGILSGSIVIGEEEYPLEVPSDSLKTDKNFDFGVESGGAVNLVVDFDLSQSIVESSGEYHLKPVIHLNEAQTAATIQGSIAADTFEVDTEVFDAIVTVTNGDEVYTQVVASQADPGAATDFRIYWLVPNQEYQVDVEVNGVSVYQETVSAASLDPGSTFVLNSGTDI